MFYISNCGHDSHHLKPCDIEHRHSLTDYLMLLVKKEAWFYLDHEKITTKPNMVILFPPGCYIHYGCDSAGYNDDWIHFIGDSASLEQLSRLNLPMCQPCYPYDFHRLSQYVRLMTDVFHGHSAYTADMLDSFMQILLHSLKDELTRFTETETTPKHFSAFSALRTQLYNNPAMTWSVPAMADSLCLSVSYFEHLYKQFFHTSCQQDIIQARLSIAKFYLTSSEMNIRSISDFCGYENELHFMRQFKKFVGMTPTEYRKKAQKSG